MAQYLQAVAKLMHPNAVYCDAAVPSHPVKVEDVHQDEHFIDLITPEKAKMEESTGLIKKAMGLVLVAGTAAYFLNRGKGSFNNQILQGRLYLQFGSLMLLGGFAMYQSYGKPNEKHMHHNH
mmetsp:Transcript_215/g.393  ORF Transcript_215/g.393 Transcript_215/m.393 type:complete len:122 (-) Transcript_215:100-465(-)